VAKEKFPETVRVAKAFVAVKGITTLNYATIKMGLGEDEVALLLASKWIMQNNLASGLWAYLWKRSFPNIDDRIPARWAEDTNIIDIDQTTLSTLTEVGSYEDKKTRYIQYPYPFVLIRDPQLVGYSDTDDQTLVSILLYYVIVKVTDKELAELMVKDHD